MRWFALSHSWAWSPTSALEVVSLREARRAGRAALLSLQAQGGEVCHWACDLQAESFFFFKAFISLFDFHGDSDGKESACTVGDPSSIPVGMIPWRRKWQPTPVFLPGESHRRRSLVGYSPWGCTEPDTWVLAVAFRIFTTSCVVFCRGTWTLAVVCGPSTCVRGLNCFKAF